MVGERQLGGEFQGGVGDRYIVKDAEELKQGGLLS
jgi:hypothetical protein